MKYVYDMHLSMHNNQVILAYEGEFTQEITKAVLKMAETNLQTSNEESSIKRKVFNVMVECLQNIVKHSDEIKEADQAIFMIGRSKEFYEVASGNYVYNENVESLKSKLTQVNSLDKDGLKSLYKDVIKGGELSSKGGAGLGFIDMARKSGNKLNFSFEKVNDKYSFFSLKTQISKIKN